jgi:hypothetical protein
MKLLVLQSPKLHPTTTTAKDGRWLGFLGLFFFLLFSVFCQEVLSHFACTKWDAFLDPLI